jgi:DNA repair protein RecO (recombination protein O)
MVLMWQWYTGQTALSQIPAMELRYNAIVLRKKEVGETDRLYTLYTESAGKLQLVAKGVRKPEAKLAGQLETLMQGLVIVVKGRGAGKIAGAVAEKSFLHLRNDLDVLKRVLEAVSIFERLVGWEEKDEVLFGLLGKYLDVTNALAKEHKKEKVLLITEGFLFQLFAHLGYEIETETCVVSGKKLAQGEKHFFSPSAGGMLRYEHAWHAHGALPISESVIKLIRLFLSNKLEVLSKVTVAEADLREARQVATRFFQWIES